MHPSIIFLLAVCFLFLRACDVGSSQIERDFKGSVRRLNELIRAYNRIPQHQKAYGQGAIIWKDKEQLKSFYEKYRDEFRSINDSLSNISRIRENNVWFDDAMFCRAILYSLWTRVDPDKDIVEKAILVFGEFVDLLSPSHIEELTKTAMQESFWNEYKEIISPSLPYEENARILFQGSIAYLFLRMKEYEKAIKQYETIVKTYPNSKFAPHAADQIKTIKDLVEGRITIPDVSP